MKGLREVLNEHGYLIHNIRGDSMMPMLDEKKDVVKIVRVERPLKKYDLPLYERDGKYVLHRIIDVKKNKYICCGDNRWQEEVVRPEQILGVTSSFYKGDKWISVDDEEYLRYAKEVVEHRCDREKEARKNRRLGLQGEINLSSSVLEAVMNLLKMYRFALTGTEIPLSGKPDYERIYKIAKQHGIEGVCFSYIEKHKDDVPGEIFVEWKNSRNKIQRRNLLFEAERNELYALLNQEKIRFLPLKGIVFNGLYPVKNVRYSSDNDFYIGKENAEKVHKIMKERGYECKTDCGVHDSYYMEPVYNFEFHRDLFVKEKSFGHVFDHPFDFSREVHPGEWEMKKEYFVAYNLAHFFKHYTGGGSGFRYFGDFYVMKTRVMADSFDTELFFSLLKKARLTDFYGYVSRVSEAIFEGKGEISREDLTYILGSGLYGTLSNQIKNEIRAKGKTRYLFGRLFPEYSVMKQRFRILKYVPVLLPVMWVVRMILFLADGKTRDITLQTIKEQEG